MLDKQFSTPIFYKLFSRFESQSIQSEITDTLTKVNFNKVPYWGSHNHSISDTTFKTSLISEHNMLVTLEVIKKVVKEYFESIDYNKDYELTIKESWLTKQGKGEYAVPHNHGAFDISGVYYYATNGNDGDIHFVNPAPVTDTSKFINDTQYIKYKPAVGTMILFPSWLMHFVDENETDNRRISLSFNIELTEL